MVHNLTTRIRMTTSSLKRIAIGMAVAIAPILVAAQSQSTAFLTISGLGTGWGADVFRIETAGQAIVNPARCSSADGYMSELSIPGYRTHYAAALLAFVTSRQVSIVVHDTQCLYGRPLVLGLYLK